MLDPIKINSKVYWIGLNDRETTLFEKLYPIENGVAYNSYIINDEKVALIDTVKAIKTDEYINKLKDVIGDKKIDYLIVNHMEPDHSGSIYEIIKQYPEIKIVCNKKTIPMLKAFYNVTDNILEIKEGDVLELGYHKLTFVMVPMVHWPECMVSYDITDQILFSADAFGSFKTLDGGIFDDQHDLKEFEEDTRRYYVNIVGKVSKMVQKAFDKLKDVEIKFICPTHGLVWRENPGYILDMYSKLSNYHTEEGVVIVYGSMYGNTERAVEYLAKNLKEKGVGKVIVYDVSKTDKAYIVSDIWKYKGLIIGSPSYYGKAFPKIEELLLKLEEIGLNNHSVGIFGNYAWSCGAIKSLKSFLDRVNIEAVSESIEIMGNPDKEDFDKLNLMAEKICDSIK